MIPFVLLAVCSVIVLLVLIIGFFTDWSTHLDMTKSTNEVAYRIRYRDFLEKFRSVQWGPTENGWKASFFPISGDYPYVSKIHASIFRLNGTLYFFGPVGWLCIKTHFWWKYVRNREVPDQGLHWRLDDK